MQRTSDAVGDQVGRGVARPDCENKTGTAGVSRAGMVVRVAQQTWTQMDALEDGAPQGGAKDHADGGEDVDFEERHVRHLRQTAVHAQLEPDAC